MPVAFQNAVIRSPRRLRLLFSNTLAAGAFSTSFYSLESLDGFGADPPVNAALVVPDASDQVELSLQYELAPGGLYRLTVAAGVPAADLSVALAAELEFKMHVPRLGPSSGVSLDAMVRRVYQVDLVHDGRDFVEDADGDLATITGPQNAKKALTKRGPANGRPWNAEFGAYAREFVDAAPGTLPNLVGRLTQELRRDDRVVSAKVRVAQSENDGTEFMLVDVQFIDGVFDTITVRPT